MKTDIVKWAVLWSQEQGLVSQEHLDSFSTGLKSLARSFGLGLEILSKFKVTQHFRLPHVDRFLIIAGTLIYGHKTVNKFWFSNRCWEHYWSCSWSRDPTLGCDLETSHLDLGPQSWRNDMPLPVLATDQWFSLPARGCLLAFCNNHTHTPV